MKDPQRIYNYWTSAAVEQVALQSKTPWIADVKAIEGNEVMWTQSNLQNYSVLPYNSWDDDGQRVIPQPTRPPAPEMSAAYIQGMQIAKGEMMMVSGQYEADFGQPGNERSGKAINARQRQGDLATYHFIDGQAIGIRFTGKILIDLIPKIYDTRRVIRIMGEDGKEAEIVVDPKAPQAFEERKTPVTDKVQQIFNPSVGYYDVRADIGPAYATRRQEAWDAFKEIVVGAPQLMPIIGDLMFRNGDFPGADAIAERLQRLVPPEATGDGPPPQVKELLDQTENMKKMIASMIEDAAKKNIEIESLKKGRDIEAFDAETKRITAVANANELPPQDLMPIIQQMVQQALSGTLPPYGEQTTEQPTDADLQAMQAAPLPVQ